MRIEALTIDWSDARQERMIHAVLVTGNSAAGADQPVVVIGGEPHGLGEWYKGCPVYLFQLWGAPQSEVNEIARWNEATLAVNRASFRA